VTSAELKPTCGLAAAMFSTLAAITAWLLTLPPVNGSVALGRGVGVLVGDGVAVDADELGDVELLAAGWESGRLSATPTPIPAAMSRATAAARATRRARLMS
jgi:hypothetical protein